MTRSTAEFTSSVVIAGFSRLAVKIAASFNKFARSAPAKPGVR